MFMRGHNGQILVLYWPENAKVTRLLHKKCLHAYVVPHEPFVSLFFSNINGLHVCQIILCKRHATLALLLLTGDNLENDPYSLLSYSLVIDDNNYFG